MNTPTPSRQDAPVPVEQVEFLRDLAKRLFQKATPAMGFDQGDVDQLYAIAHRLAAVSAGEGERTPEMQRAVDGLENDVHTGSEFSSACLIPMKQAKLILDALNIPTSERGGEDALRAAGCRIANTVRAEHALPSLSWDHFTRAEQEKYLVYARAALSTAKAYGKNRTYRSGGL